MRVGLQEALSVPLSLCIGLIVIVFVACVGPSQGLALTLDLLPLRPRGELELALSSLSVTTMREWLCGSVCM